MVYIATKKNDYVIVHSGIKGQKWGVRRFQNEDGTLTAAGKARYLPTSATDGMKKNKDLEERIRQNKQKRHSTEANYFAALNQLPFIADGAEYRRTYQKMIEGELTADKLAKAQKYLKDSVYDLYYKDILNIMAKYPNTKYSEIREQLYDVDRMRELYGKEVGNIINKAIDDAWDYLKSSADRNKASGMPTSAKNALDDEAYNQSKRNAANNMGKGSMPTSAIAAKNKAEYESKMKKNIPASAWNQKVSSTSNTKKNEIGVYDKMKQEARRVADHGPYTRRDKVDPTQTVRAASNQTERMNYGRFKAYKSSR